MECGKPFLILIKVRSIMWPITKEKGLEAILQGFFFGGRYRTRTCDLLHVKQMLYQLS